MAKRRLTLKQSRAAALRGEVDAALEGLAYYAAKGDDSAAASLAELYAFLGRWDDVVPNAGRLIANPGAVYAGNVFDEMVPLLGRAGREGADWESIARHARTASEHNESRQGMWDRLRDWNRTLLDKLVALAERNGEPPHELVPPKPQPMSDKTERERLEWFENAVANVDTLRPTLKGDEHAKNEHFFALAKRVLDDKALELYLAHGDSFVMAWQSAEYVAGLYVRRGDPEAAWSALADNVHDWSPVDHAQVAPLSLLIDEELYSLMNRERCDLVLTTPRGADQS